MPSFSLSNERMLRCNISPAPGIFIRSDLVIKVRRIDPTYYPVADYMFYTKWYLQGKGSLIVNTPISFYKTADSATCKGGTSIQMAYYTVSFKISLVNGMRPSLIKRIVLTGVIMRWGERLRTHYGNDAAKNFLQYYDAWLVKPIRLNRILSRIIVSASLGKY